MKRFSLLLSVLIAVTSFANGEHDKGEYPAAKSIKRTQTGVAPGGVLSNGKPLIVDGQKVEGIATCSEDGCSLTESLPGGKNGRTFIDKHDAGLVDATTGEIYEQDKEGSFHKSGKKVAVKRNFLGLGSLSEPAAVPDGKPAAAADPAKPHDIPEYLKFYGPKNVASLKEGAVVAVLFKMSTTYGACGACDKIEPVVKKIAKEKGAVLMTHYKDSEPHPGIGMVPRVIVYQNTADGWKVTANFHGINPSNFSETEKKVQDGIPAVPDSAK